MDQTMDKTPFITGKLHREGSPCPRCGHPMAQVVGVLWVDGRWAAYDSKPFCTACSMHGGLPGGVIQ